MTDTDGRLREAFPALVWTPWADAHVGTPGPLANAPKWRLYVNAGLEGWSLDGRLALGAGLHGAVLGDDPIGELRAIITAEGIRLAREADEFSEVARAIGGQPQSDWRAAAAEDNASHMQRELAKARERVRVLEKVGKRISMSRAKLEEAVNEALNGTIPVEGVDPADQLLEVAHILSDALDAPLHPEVVEWRRERLKAEASLPTHSSCPSSSSSS